MVPVFPAIRNGRLLVLFLQIQGDINVMEIHVRRDGAFGNVNIGMPVRRKGQADHRRVRFPFLGKRIIDALVRRADTAPEYHVHDPFGQREGTGAGVDADQLDIFTGPPADFGEDGGVETRGDPGFVDVIDGGAGRR